jgi:hypothetical protein
VVAWPTLVHPHAAAQTPRRDERQSRVTTQHTRVRVTHTHTHRADTLDRHTDGAESQAHTEATQPVNFGYNARDYRLSLCRSHVPAALHESTTLGHTWIMHAPTHSTARMAARSIPCARCAREWRVYASAYREMWPARSRQQRERESARERGRASERAEREGEREMTFRAAASARRCRSLGGEHGERLLKCEVRSLELLELERGGRLVT